MLATEFIKGGNYLDKAKLERDGEQAHTIRGVEIAEFKDAKTGLPDQRLQLELNDGVKFTLNSTNTRVLIKHLGDDTAGWINRSIVLWFDETVSFAGRMTGGVRVRVPKLQDEVGF